MNTEELQRSILSAITASANQLLDSGLTPDQVNAIIGPMTGLANAWFVIAQEVKYLKENSLII